LRAREFIVVLALVAVIVLGFADTEPVKMAPPERETPSPIPVVKNWSVHGVTASDPIDGLLKTFGPPLRDTTISSHRTTILKASNGAKIRRDEMLLYGAVSVSGSQLELDGTVAVKEGDSKASVVSALGPPRSVGKDGYHYDGARVYLHEGLVNLVEIESAGKPAL